eukprot:NODE_530_length_6411_cov_0.882288.p3 type:complete len:417 gc:universal NODE_530_length_6411_cov_0.882288:3484-4734(+)
MNKSPQPSIQRSNTCSKDQYIHQDKHYAGYIKIKRGNLFYYYIPNQNNNLVIWLNGGPGCSSDIGLLLENGPNIIQVDGSMKKNEFGWHRLANMLYIDQPVNAGFSQGEPVKSEMDVSSDFVELMSQLLDVYPQMQDMKIYISGESYAGTYIPYIAQGLLKKNYNLRGLLIGNGWIDPMPQYRSYIEYAKKNALLLPKYEAEIEKKWQACVTANNKKELIFIRECENIADLIFQSSKEINKGKCTNMYDIRLIEEKGCGENWPYQLPEVYKYLQNPVTVAKVHANKTWVECDGSVYNALSKDTSPPTVHLLPDLLQKIPILLFNGDKDFICNHIGQENMIKNLQWNNQKGFKNSPVPVYLNEHLKGEIQAENNLGFFKIYDASHMVPIDQPEISYHMLKHFMEGTIVIYIHLDERN